MFNLANTIFSPRVRVIHHREQLADSMCARSLGLALIALVGYALYRTAASHQVISRCTTTSSLSVLDYITGIRPCYSVTEIATATMRFISGLIGIDLVGASLLVHGKEGGAWSDFIDPPNIYRPKFRYW